MEVEEYAGIEFITIHGVKNKVKNEIAAHGWHLRRPVRLPHVLPEKVDAVCVHSTAEAGGQDQRTPLLLDGCEDRY